MYVILETTVPLRTFGGLRIQHSKAMITTSTYVAFLRSINVGRHHKLPMGQLKQELQQLGCTNVITVLNSGNIIFTTTIQPTATLAHQIADHLERIFHFSVPTIVFTLHELTALIALEPFKKVTLTKSIRRYVSLLQKNVTSTLELPWQSADASFTILLKTDRAIFSVLDLSEVKTPKAMERLEREFGKEITTRNWNTIERIAKKLPA